MRYDVDDVTGDRLSRYMSKGLIAIRPLNMTVSNITDFTTSTEALCVSKFHIISYMDNSS